MARKVNPLKTYVWNASSLIECIDIRQQEKGSVAYLYAPSGEEKLAQLHALRELFTSKGWMTSSDTRNGKQVLRLTGIKNEGELINLLQDGKYTEGSARVTQAGVQDKPTGIMDSVHRNSLRASGIFYTLGNIFYVLCGLFGDPKKINYWQVNTGVAFGLGDTLLAVFGGKDDNRQFKSLLTKLKVHLKKEGIEIPKDAVIYAETTPHNDGLWTKVSNFIHEHINKFKASAEVLGGIMYFNSGRTEKPSPNRWKQATAVIFSLGFGSTLFIKEKKSDPEKLKHAGPLEKAWAFVQEKPLRLGGWSGLSNTLFTTIGALKKRPEQIKQGLNIYKYDLAAAGSMLVGNNLYALSNKATGGSITEEGLIRDIYGIAAQVLNHLPEDKREAAIKVTVDFLGERVEIKDSREQAEALLREQMNQSMHNPWFKANTITASPRAAAGEPARKRRKFAAIPAGRDGKWVESVAQHGAMSPAK